MEATALLSVSLCKVLFHVLYPRCVKEKVSPAVSWLQFLKNLPDALQVNGSQWLLYPVLSLRQQYTLWRLYKQGWLLLMACTLELWTSRIPSGLRRAHGLCIGEAILRLNEGAVQMKSSL